MPTIRDVARNAGVSTTTVSDALSGRGRLPQATRERVRAVADELGYRPHLGARHLRQGRTGSVGLALPQRTVGLGYYMDLAVGAAEVAHAADLSLTLVPPARGGSAPRLGVDGMIVSDPALGDPLVAALAAARVPVVTCDRDLTPGAVHAGSVETDHLRTTEEVLDHLAAGGANRVAALCPVAETSFGLDTTQAYLEWCEARGQLPMLRPISLACDTDEVQGAVADLWSRGPEPDAVLAVPEGSGAPALQALRSLGVHVPADCLFAVYTDSVAMAAMDVTAVDLDPREMGRRAAALLVAVIDEQLPPGQVDDLPARLRVRASSTR